MVYLWSKLKHLIGGGIDRCLLCQAHGATLCSNCSRDLPWNDQACLQCAHPLTDSDAVCQDCQHNPPPFRAISTFKYAFPIDRMLAQFKYHGRLAPGAVLGHLLADTICSHSDSLPDILIPVPLHDTRLSERGFNQATELARPVSKVLGVPIEQYLVTRSSRTAMQKGLNAKRRQENISDAFHISRKHYLELGQPKSVALIDDVMTTGATVTALTRVLKQAGVKDVQVWTLARTP